MKEGALPISETESTKPTQTTSAFPKKILIDAASAWDWSPRKILVMWGVPFIISLAVIVAGLISKDLYKWIIAEDSLVETSAVVFYFLAFLGSLLIARRFLRNGDKLFALLYIILTLALFFLIGEELGWGQRIFHWETPETLRVINKQSETTLHNISGVEEAFKWLQMLVGAYGTLLPLVTLYIHPQGGLGAIARRVVPHYSLIPYFMFIFFWKIFRALYPNPKYFEWAISEFNEVMELILAIGFSLFILYQLRSFRIEPKKPPVGGQAGG